VIDLRALRYFVAAIEQGSISGAAKACHVAQPSVTLAVSKLEQQFDTLLLHRHHKGVEPTESGKAFFARAKELLQHADGLESQFTPSKVRQKLRLSIAPDIQLNYLKNIARQLNTERTGVELVIVESREESDVWLSSEPRCPAGWRFMPLASEHYTLLIPKSNPLAFQENIRISMLDQQNLIERQHCENRPLFENFIAHANLRLPISARVQNEESAIALSAMGLGICISPLPPDFEDERFRCIALNELIQLDLPERLVGLCLSERVPETIRELLESKV
jgi:LysR family hydrogen peroxide-inducible transcriptional activator